MIVAIKCPKYRSDNPDTRKFCGECGTPLEADVVHTKTLEIPAEKLAIGSDFADHDQIIQQRERCFVTFFKEGS